jgi:hypothetical protein
MLACAFIYSTVLIGPWGVLKETARAVGTPGWFAYAGIFLALNLVILPGLFWLAVRSGQLIDSPAKTSIRKLFSDYAAVLAPLGLTAWVAFSLSFVLINFSYAWSVLSDPLGWGWNLLGTVGLKWTPYIPGLVPYLQVPVLLLGLTAAIALALRTARQHGQSPWAAAPVAAIGTAGQPITFTSSTNTGPDQWSGLVFDGGTGDLRHATVRYGGNVNSINANCNTSGLGFNIAARNVLTGELRLENSQVLSERYLCNNCWTLNKPAVQT